MPRVTGGQVARGTSNGPVPGLSVRGEGTSECTGLGRPGCGSGAFCEEQLSPRPPLLLSDPKYSLGS